MGRLSLFRSNTTTNRDQSNSDPVPAYTPTADVASADEPPAFTPSAPPPAFPTSFNIGSHRTEQLVSVDQLKQHLLVLGAFNQLKTRVHAVSGAYEAQPQAVEMVFGPDTKWSIFVQMAVHRFELYIQHVLSAGLDGQVPVPLDVALVWHSYALNPRNYAEDVARKLAHLNRPFGGFPLAQLAARIDKTTLEPFGVSVEEGGLWTKLTGTAYDPIEWLQSSVGLATRCPLTGEELWSVWVDKDGQGYAQQGWSVYNSRGDKVNAALSGTVKLAKDIAQMATDPDATLAGTLLMPNETNPALKELRLKRFKLMLLTQRSKLFAGGEWGPIAETLGYTRSRATAALGLRLGRSSRIIARIMNSYTNGTPFSLDLGLAVLRQGEFVDKMVSFGWTVPGRFDEDDTVLKRCVARLHAFYDLMASQGPSLLAVPTLDIDLAWHTHQLGAIKYEHDTTVCIGRFIDHDDKIETNQLGDAYDLTARAWKSRFGVPYSVCGCSLPSDSAMSKLGSKLGMSSASKSAIPTDALLGSAEDVEDADATHASTHNAIHMVGHPTAERLRKKRTTELAARKRRDEKRAAKGDKFTRRDNHVDPFLMPVMMFPMYGFYAYPAVGAACAAVSGAIVGPGAASIGSCAAGATGACAGGAMGGGACGGGGACAGGACGGGGGGCGGGGGGCGGGGGGGGGGCGGGGC